MAGLYIHIPFCSKACHYCNFHFSTSLHRKPAFLAALAKEISHPQQPEQVAIERKIETIYFGGGTPSLLSSLELGAILENLQQNFSTEANAEITLETNPDDITASRLQEWHRIGINRLSIGVQSFFEADLKWMNRAHTAAHAINCIKLAQDAGFNNLTIDLIYGLPQMTDLQWQQNIETAVALQVPHLSCYALTVEEKTALHHFIQKGKVAPVNDEKQAAHFLLLMEALERQGYEHYEISNFAKPGMHSRHNSSYWQGNAYFGFGPSAHSFDGKNTRWWNVPNNTLYIQNIEAGQPTFEAELLTNEQRINEAIMTLLRTAGGLPVDKAIGTLGNLHYPAAQWQEALATIADFENKGWLMQLENTLQLTRTGKLYADHISASLFAEK